MRESRSLYTDRITNRFWLLIPLLFLCATPSFAKSTSTTPRGKQIQLSSEEFLTTDFETSATVIYLGNTESEYLHPFLVRQELAAMVSERPKDTLHIAALSTRGLSRQLIDVMNEKKYIEKSQGKLAVVVNRDDYMADEELRELAAKADYIIFTSSQKQVTETIAEAGLIFAETQDRPLNVEVFEGGNVARNTLYNIVTRSRFGQPKHDIEINCRMNYNSREVRNEGGGLAATELLGLLKKVKTSLKNIDIHAFLHKEPGVYHSINFDPSSSFGEEKQIEVDSIRVSERLERMASGKAHRQNQVGMEMGHVANIYMATDPEVLSIILVPSDWLRDNIKKGNYSMEVTVNSKTAFGDMTGWEEKHIDLFPDSVFVFSGKLTDFNFEPNNSKPVEINLKLRHRFRASGPAMKDYFAKYILISESVQQIAASHYSYYEFLSSQLRALETHLRNLTYIDNVSLVKPFNDPTAPDYADQKLAMAQYSALIEEVKVELAEIDEANMHKLWTNRCEKVFF